MADTGRFRVLLNPCAVARRWSELRKTVLETTRPDRYSRVEKTRIMSLANQYIEMLQGSGDTVGQYRLSRVCNPNADKTGWILTDHYLRFIFTVLKDKLEDHYYGPWTLDEYMTRLVPSTVLNHAASGNDRTPGSKTVRPVDLDDMTLSNFEKMEGLGATLLAHERDGCATQLFSPDGFRAPSAPDFCVGVWLLKVIARIASWAFGYMSVVMGTLNSSMGYDRPVYRDRGWKVLICVDVASQSLLHPVCYSMTDHQCQPPSDGPSPTP
ncbi:hypothetical protein GE09DRAFT_1054633 [Coniochaeta sp. 2T2.1]|nr:hypothetical protein GE09DRAFT_1054633 [Coniochaeta sp. 2T2.1]